MNILVSNDDGILSPGIAVLAEACRSVAQVTVVAPDREQSGTSHALTLHRPLRPQRRFDGSFQVDGTPTDCVLLAVGALMPDKPDFVFSGVNLGPNMGEDVLYSGTVSAAMEAVTLGIPGIAISFASRVAEQLGSFQPVLARLVRRIVEVPEFPRNMLLNVNLPDLDGPAVKGFKITKLGSRYFSESLTRMKDPWGKEVFWIGGGEITWTGDAESDHQAVKDGFISVTPLGLDLTSYSLFETVRGWALEG
ncbi:MAG TPA: 5'/3'-nucleotidase SurE [Gemmatimonadales bacterium]|nr:5'/3'-nucleotidase SurE [Gemmatimonadales bacterium]